jgi:hypothetical protein
MVSVPYTIAVGDVIAVLRGAKVLFVLRPVDDHCRLIGPCCVHGGGIMDGKAFPEDADDLE